MLLSRSLLAVVLLSSLTTTYAADQTESRQLTRYSEIRIKAPVEMSYTVGPSASLQVTAAPEVLAQLTTTVSNGELTIDLKSGSDVRHAIHIVATGPALSGVSIDAPVISKPPA